MKTSVRSENFKAVFFDWDGTLVDTIPGVLEAHNHVRSFYNLEAWTLPWFKANMRQSALKLYPQIYGEDAQVAIDMLYAYIEEHHLNKLAPMEGAEKLLEDLRRAEKPMSVVSNKRHKYLLREVEHMGWMPGFDGVIGAGVTEKDKPDPDPVLKLLAEQGLSGNDICYIGDTETDLLTAKNTGCCAILVLNGEDKSNLISQYSPFLVVNDCHALREVLI